jgi:hypothetical protein
MKTNKPALGMSIYATFIIVMTIGVCQSVEHDDFWWGLMTVLVLGSCIRGFFDWLEVWIIQLRSKQ